VNGREIETRAFAVPFDALDRWDPISFHFIPWAWPRSVLVSLREVLRPRKQPVDRTRFGFSDLQPITIHFDGTIDKRKIRHAQEYRMELFVARPGDIVVSKIDLKNGALGVVPAEWSNVVVTNHFAVYEPDRRRLLPEFLLYLIQTSFMKDHLWRNKVGAEGRREVKLDFFESLPVPLLSLEEQASIVKPMQLAHAELTRAERDFKRLIETTNKRLFSFCTPQSLAALKDKYFSVPWPELARWDVKSARTSVFRLANKEFLPLASAAGDATILVRPWEAPEATWPTYGVNNRDGVFFSGCKLGREFTVPQKHIEKDWFFHNPTRSSVGSLGIVPEVPRNAITSPEYQVWRIHDKGSYNLVPGFVAVMIATQFFREMIRIHKIGAVKERLYVSNLLEIHIPVFPAREQEQIAESRKSILGDIEIRRRNLVSEKAKLEASLLGLITC
jgi:hypothetical protein